MKRTRALPLVLAALLIAAPAMAGQEIDGALLLGGPVTVTTDIIVLDDFSATGDMTGNGNWVLGNSTTADAITLMGVLTQSGAATFAGATTFSSTVGVTGVLTATGGLTGDVTGSAAGALGNFTVVESDTLKPGAGTAFYLRAKDGQDDATLNCATFAGAVTGNVTGDVTGNLLGDAAQTVAYKGNLPTVGDHTGEFYKNTVGDSLFYATNSAWIVMVPK